MCLFELGLTQNFLFTYRDYHDYNFIFAMCTRGLNPQSIPNDSSLACLGAAQGTASTWVSEPGTRMFKCLSLWYQLLLFSSYFYTKQLRVQTTSCVYSLSIKPLSPVNHGQVTLYYCKWLPTGRLPIRHTKKSAAPNQGQDASGRLDEVTN